MFNIFSKKKKSLLAGLLTFALVFGMGLSLLNGPVQAVSKSELNSLKKQQQQLAEKKANIQKQADALNSKVNAQTQKLNLLTSKLDVTNSEIKNLSKQIAIYTNSIAAMENELNVDEQKEQELLKKYKQRMRVMEESGGISYISLLFEANSFEDLLSRIDCVNAIMEYDNGLIKDVREAKVKVKNAKADMEAEMADQQQVFATYQEKQADLVSQQAEVKKVLLTLTAGSADYEKQLQSVKSLQSSLNGQISDMASKLTEQERLKAEQAAADKASSDGGNWYGDAAGTGTGQDIVNYAKTFLGVKYVYGGTSPSGFDCSGFVYYCYRHFGYWVNRTASGLAYNGVAVSSSALKPGDVILFTELDGDYIGHTGIYIGNGQFIHAPHTGDVVKISSLSDAYYTRHYWGARRIIT
jgi:peptidoglycan DL-endopeptidase CwlO